MAHINTRLSDHVEIGAVRIEEQEVEISRTDGGNEVRNTRWSQPLLRFEIAFPTSQRDDSVYLEVRNAYRAAMGMLHSFKFRDWSDYQATDAEFAVSDGVTTTYQLSKPYTFGSETFTRNIQNPVSPVALKADGVTISSGYSVDYSTGIVTFTSVPADLAVLTWTGEFDIPVRFDSPLQSVGLATHLEHHESIVLQEVRL